MECVCALIRPRFILLSERVLGNGARTHVNSKEKITSTGGSREGRTRDAASRRTGEPSTLPTELFRPLLKVLVSCCFLRHLRAGSYSEHIALVLLPNCGGTNASFHLVLLDATLTSLQAMTVPLLTCVIQMSDLLR